MGGKGGSRASPVPLVTHLLQSGPERKIFCEWQKQLTSNGGLLRGISWILLWKLFSKFFLHFSFFYFIMGTYISMALRTLTDVQKQLSSKLSFSQ